MRTKVKFLYHEGHEDLLAYFPFEEWCNDTMSCYSHIGQHSACHPFYAKECREATEQEARSLKIELLQIGYKLDILNNWEQKEYSELEEQINEAFWAIK
jgi:hypothetical protein